MESERKCKSDNDEAKKTCKVMTQEKIIPDTLRSSSCPSIKN
jgi:hypothetical protein